MKYWPAPFLPFAGGFLEQALEGSGLDVDVERDPLGLVDQADQLLEVDRVGEARLRAAEDVAEHSRLAAELAQGLGVGVGEVGAALLAEVGPVGVLGKVEGALVGHLEEEQIRDLLDVVAVVDAVVAEGVAEAPELGDDVTHAATSSRLRSSRRSASSPSKTRFARPQPPRFEEHRHVLEVVAVDREVGDEVLADVLHPLRLVVRELPSGGHALDGLVDALLGGVERRRVERRSLDHRDDVDERLVMRDLEGSTEVVFGEVLGRLQQRLTKIAEGL